MPEETQKTKKVWTEEEIREMWPQAAGELRGFQGIEVFRWRISAKFKRSSRFYSCSIRKRIFKII